MWGQWHIPNVSIPINCSFSILYFYSIINNNYCNDLIFQVHAHGSHEIPLQRASVCFIDSRFGNINQSNQNTDLWERLFILVFIHIYIFGCMESNARESVRIDAVSLQFVLLQLVRALHGMVNLWMFYNSKGWLKFLVLFFKGNVCGAEWWPLNVSRRNLYDILCLTGSHAKDFAWSWTGSLLGERRKILAAVLKTDCRGKRLESGRLVSGRLQ